MSRALAAAGWSYVALCGLILASHREIPRDIPRGGEPPNPAAWAWKMMAEASRGGTAAMKAAREQSSKQAKQRAKKKKQES